MKHRKRRAFTFIEIMFVVVIIGLLTAVVAQRVVGQMGTTKRNTTFVQLKNIEQALARFEADNDRFPTQAEGLAALLEDPKAKRAGYLDSPTLPTDAWKQPFQYRAPGENRVFYDLWSVGADGRDGSDDDVTNWQDVAAAR